MVTDVESIDEDNAEKVCRIDWINNVSETPSQKLERIESEIKEIEAAKYIKNLPEFDNLSDRAKQFILDANN